ncbi:MAG: DNA replication and repair protein RecF [Solirubrobacterales bacterium]|nr:DNA replication and repair protein RecF [Solirubrobacterales bacterium]
MDATAEVVRRMEGGGLAEDSPRVCELSVRDFRSYDRGRFRFGGGLTVIFGPNGAGKTNLLEALYFGCTGRSCRASNEREVVRFGAGSTRVTVTARAPDGDHELAVGFVPGEPKHLSVDGASVETLLGSSARPLLTVFLPDRLELIKGPPSIRRAHLDQLVAALWPARVATRRAYAQALAQRNALIARIRARGGSRGGLTAWDLQLARHGLALMQDRTAGVEAAAGLAAEVAAELGLGGMATLAYRPRSAASTVEDLAAELAARTDGDLERGFTAHGPHRDELAVLHDGRDLRTYGSQGQQRLVLLALLLAEHEAIGRLRGTLPVMLLDDVMSELDSERRQALSVRLRCAAGQTVITASELDHVPGADADDVATLAVPAGRNLGSRSQPGAG